MMMTMMMVMITMMITMMVGVGRPQQGSPARASRASRSRPFEKFPSRRCWRRCVILAFSSAFLPLRWSSACSRGVARTAGWSEEGRSGRAGFPGEARRMTSSSVAVGSVCCWDWEDASATRGVACCWVVAPWVGWGRGACQAALRGACCGGCGTCSGGWGACCGGWGACCGGWGTCSLRLLFLLVAFASAGTALAAVLRSSAMRTL